MKAIVIRAPGGLDRLEVCDLPDPGAPGRAALGNGALFSLLRQISRRPARKAAQAPQLHVGRLPFP